MFQGLIRFYDLEELHAVHPGRIEVHKDDTGRVISLVSKVLEGFLSVGCVNQLIGGTEFFEGSLARDNFSAGPNPPSQNNEYLS